MTFLETTVKAMRTSLNTIFLLFYWLVFGAMLDANAKNYVKLTQYNTENGLQQNSINSIMQDQEGYLWIATAEGLNQYDGYRISNFSRQLANQYVELVWQDSTGLIWIGSEQANYILDKKQGEITPIVFSPPLDYDLSYPVINSIVEDNNQDLWLSTFHELFFYDRSANRFEFVLSISELFFDPERSHAIRDILLVDQQLILATSNGLYSLNLKTNQINLIKHTQTVKLNSDENNVKKLFLTKDKRLLVGTVEGLYSIDSSLLGVADKTNQSELVVADLNIWQLIEKEDFIWLATNKGLFRLQHKNEIDFVFKFSDTPFNTSDDDIVRMIEDREKNLWFGSKSDGLFKWHPNNAIKKHLWSKGEDGFRLSDDMVTDIHQSASKNIWFATKNGLTKLDYKTGKTTNLLFDSDEKQVVSGSTIYSVNSNKGKLWLNTFSGIQVYDEETFKREDINFPKNDNNLFSSLVNQLFFFNDDVAAIVAEDGIYEYTLSKNELSLIKLTENHGDPSLILFSIHDLKLKNKEYFIGGNGRLWLYSRETEQLTLFHQLPSKKAVNTTVSGMYLDGKKLWVAYPSYGIFILDVKTGDEIAFLSEESIQANSVMDIFPDKKGNLWFTSNEGLLRINKLSHHVTKFNSNDGFVTSEFNGRTKLELENGDVFLGSVKGAFQINPNQMGNEKKVDFNLHINNISLLSKSAKERTYTDFDDEIIELQYDDFGLKIEFSALLLDKPKQVKYQYWMEGGVNIEKTPIDNNELFFPSFKAGTSRLFISAIDYNRGEESKPVSLTIISYPAPWLSKPAISFYIILFIIIISVSLNSYRKKLRTREAIYQRIKQSEERLSLALKGGNAGLWDWHAMNNSVYEPRLGGEDWQDEDKLISFKRRLSAIHFRDRNSVLTTWKDFLRGEKQVYDTVYRLQDSEGEWSWYRDIAMVSEFDDEMKPIRVTGIYTNITEKKDATEQIGLFSKALENTRDVIIILDSEKKIIAVNKAFKIISSYTSEDMMGHNLSNYISLPDEQSLTDQVFSHIEKNEYWKGEATIKNENGSRIPVLINAATFIGNDSDQYFVFSLSDIRKQKEAELALKKLINYDELTGLPNRTLLSDRMEHAMKHCKRQRNSIAIFFIDLDRFKQINDTLGHDIGDLLLVKCSSIFTSSVRSDDTVARIGGDEFIVMLEAVNDFDSIERVAQNILKKLAKSLQINEHQVTVSASIGISIYPQDARNVSGLLKQADIAMYQAKNAGRNNYQYFHKNKHSQNRGSKDLPEDPLKP